MNSKLEKVIKFSGWTPSPNTVTIGMERDNKVFSLKFEGMPEYPNGTAYLHIDCGENGADSIEVVDGTAEIKRNVTQYEGEKEAYVEILADGDVVWHSDVIMVTVKRLPLLGEKIEQAYPTAFEQALAQTAADKAAAAKSAADAAATAAGIVTEEAARQEAESERVKAENARETAEANREQAETAREQETAAAVKRTDDLVKSVEAKLENGDFVGAQGPQGPIGATGPQGAQGVQGEKGEKGEKGDTGATGPQGEKGADGADGTPGKDGLDAPQIDDTTVSDAAPWSSQHIVNMLCPPLEESGNPVVCYPVAGSNLGVTARWEPTQEGSGEPSPENIRPINGRTAVKMGRFGANLVTPFYQSGYTIEKNGLTFVVNDDYSVTVAGTATKEIYFNYQTLPYNTVSYLFSAMDKTVEKDGFIACDIAVQPYPNEGTRFYLVFTKGAAVNKTYYPQCVYGNTLPPYKIGNGSTTTLALSNTIYGGEVGADGEGRETWGYIESYAGEALPAEWICDRAVYAEGGTPPTGAQVAYKLATPIPFTATGGGAVKALSGTNTILTDADTLTVTGRADPIHIIQQLQAASAASAQALADVERAVTDI